MFMEKEENEKIQIYEIDNKKYTVITRCINNPNNVDKLYNLMCKYALSKLN